jgi:hypothetical protein
VYGATGLEVTIDHYGEITYYLGDLRGSVIAEIGNDPEETVYFNHYDDFSRGEYSGKVVDVYNIFSNNCSTFSQMVIYAGGDTNLNSSLLGFSPTVLLLTNLFK